MEEHEKIELRSEEVQEILGTPPGAIISWGTTVIFFTMIMMGLVSYLVKYPDKIRAPIVLTTTSPPASLVARSDGYISELKVKDNVKVKKGEILVVMQDPADYEDVLALEEMMDDVQHYNRKQLEQFVPPSNLLLGELQISFSIFNQNLNNFIYGATNGYEFKNKEQLRKQRMNVLAGINNDKARLLDVDEEMLIVKRQQDRTKQLYPQSATLKDLEQIGREKQALEKERKNIKASIIEKERDISIIDKQIVQINQTYSNTYNDNFTKLQSSINDLSSRIKKWKEIYLLTAPIDGIVSFHDFWKEQQFVKNNQEVMSIVPPGGDSIVGKVMVPLKGSGKVEPGQTVVIKLDGYPYEEYGSLRGIVITKSLVPKDNVYNVVVKLPKGMVSSHGEPILFNQQMAGLAEIITEKKRFIRKIFDELLGRLEDYK